MSNHPAPRAALRRRSTSIMPPHIINTPRSGSGVDAKKAPPARTRRRNLIKLGADPGEVHMATRSRKGYWRMSHNRIVQQALSNQRLKEQGVPELRSIWIKLHYGEAAKPNR